MKKLKLKIKTKNKIQNVKLQELFDTLQHQREHQARNELLHRTAQQLVNEAYLAQEDKAAQRQGKEERRQASKLLDEAFPLVKNSSQSDASVPISVASEGGRRNKKLRKRSKKKTAVEQKKETAVDRLLSGGTLTGLPLYSGNAWNIPNSDLSGGERSEVVGSLTPLGVRDLAHGTQARALSKEEREMLVKAIKAELTKHKGSSNR